MTLTMKNLNHNLITAELDNDWGITKFKYGDIAHFSKVLVYGRKSLVTRSGVEGIHGAITLCLDIKDDETERFFIELIETLLKVGRSCINEKIESRLMDYGGSYTIRCMIAPSSKLGSLDFGEHRRGWCELRIFAACRDGTGIVVEEVKL